AALGPIVCGALATHLQWRSGFGAAGVGMLLGLAQFYVAQRNLGEIGIRRSEPQKTHARIAVGGAIMVAVIIALCVMGVIGVAPNALAHAAKSSLVTIAVIYFACILLFGRLDASEKRRVFLIILL